MSASTHFTAVLSIEKATTTTPPAERYAKAEAPARVVSEVAKLVIRAGTIEALRAKVAAHVALIEEAE
ncbi:hypothetical protein PQE18_gp51 [Arthrobacter phage DrSierra]|uniref:Uncharacterized protein n=1 Tax=Arthrobacter phage DrSierra TaxID=2704034 RepID=A0A6G6XK95_9CAUD|nr:hypothetical protein PQE18_gp51 [Arthrobacter phage DrSierra]QIG58529.1 hypothetical protein SEA_DRSIERRA_51 [Arthrobacter phage DrSierra]